MDGAKKSWRQEMPDFVQFLETALGRQVRLHEEVLGYHLYFTDLSDWKLRFSDRTPVIWVGEADLAAMSARELAQSLADVVKTRALAERNPIVAVQGSGQELRAYLKTSSLPLLVLDREAQTAIRESRRPTGELLDRLSSQLDLSLLAPYETSKPVTGSRFFGREFEVRRILQGSDSNFAIMGIRRIGKTSLMREIERQLREQAQETGDAEAAERILFMDCSALTAPAGFIQEVVRKLRPQELMRLSSKQFPIFFPDFLERMAQRYGGPIFFFLDEFDKVLTWHYNDDTLLNALRASSNQGHSRYIVGGFREVMRAFSDLESPLYNFARPVRLKEFSREQAAAMVLDPLEKLGVRFERRNDVVNRIFDETAGQPNLIQFYCSILVERMDRQGTARSRPRACSTSTATRTSAPSCSAPSWTTRRTWRRPSSSPSWPRGRPSAPSASRASTRRWKSAASRCRCRTSTTPAATWSWPAPSRRAARTSVSPRPFPAHAGGELRRRVFVQEDSAGRNLVIECYVTLSTAKPHGGYP